MSEAFPFQMDHHYGYDFGEWGSAPRKPLIECDMAHRGELMDSVIGPDVVTGKPTVYHIVRCELCIATHVWPLPPPESLAQYYEREFYQTDKPDMITRYERDADWWLTCVHNPLLDACVRHGQLPHDPKLLDIGAGPGLMLRAAGERDWITRGIEPSPVCAERLHQRNEVIYHGTLETYMESAQRRVWGLYDVLVLYETLEHCPCPEETLLHCYDLLAPGGMLVICVPNDFSPLQLLACEKFNLPRYWLAPPQHLFYFTPKTLQLLVRRCGFTICEMRGTYPLERFMLADDICYVGNDKLGRRCHETRMQYEHTFFAEGRWDELEAEYRANITQRIGREIVCVAKKVA